MSLGRRIQSDAPKKYAGLGSRAALARTHVAAPWTIETRFCAVQRDLKEGSKEIAILGPFATAMEAEKAVHDRMSKPDDNFGDDD